MSHPAPPPEPEIHRAARLGDIAALEQLIATGTDIDARCDLGVDHGPHLRGLTPLMVAARSIDGATTETLRWLLDHGADLLATSDGGNTAAWYAAGKGGRWESHEWRLVPDHVDRLRFLLDAGIDATEVNFIGRSLLTEASQAGDPARVKLLIERGAIISPRFDPERAQALVDSTVRAMRAFYKEQGIPEEHLDQQAELHRLPPASRLSSSQIPLFCAAESGSAECVRLLLDAGAPIDALDDSNRTALFFADSAPVAELLIARGIDTHHQSEFGQDALGELLAGGCSSGACGPARFEVARALMAAEVDLQSGPRGSRLYDAAFTHAADAVEFLLAAGADPQKKGGSDTTPLHGICWQGEYQESSVNESAERIIDLLIAAGLEPDVRDAQGQTPLHDAALGDWGNPTAIRALLKHGADPDPADHHGETPLMLAASRGELACIRLLLAAGADPSRTNESGESAITLAEAHLQSWQDICQTKMTIDIGFYEPPEVVEQRHREALQTAQVCVNVLRAAIAAS